MMLAHQLVKQLRDLAELATRAANEVEGARDPVVIDATFLEGLATFTEVIRSIVKQFIRPERYVN